MLVTITLAALLTTAPLPMCEEASGPGDPELRALYRSGVDYDDFLATAARRRALWVGNTDKAQAIDPAMVRRARETGGRWHFLVVAVDGCSDSVSTIPYLARLVAEVEGLELRVVDSTVGRAVMEAHRTPDGRAATPTVLLLDDAFEEAGCFVERPMELQARIADWRDVDPTADLCDAKMAWYAEDAGRETVQEFFEMLESAGRGERVCQG